MPIWQADNTVYQPKEIVVLDSFSPLENLKAFAITYAAGVASAIFVSLYVKWAKDHDGGMRW